MKYRQNNYYRNRGKERSPLRGEWDRNPNNVDVTKFISKNECLRADETNKQTVERVTKIEEEVIMEILNHKSVGIRAAFNQVDDKIFEFDHSDTNTNL